MTSIFYDKLYTESYLVTKSARVIVSEMMTNFRSGQAFDHLKRQCETCLRLGLKISDLRRRVAARMDDASEAASAADAVQKLDTLKARHLDRFNAQGTAIGPAEMDALERNLRQLMLMIIEMANALINMIRKFFGVHLPVIDTEPLRTAVYGNQEYRAAKTCNRGLVQATDDAMRDELDAATAVVSDRDQAMKSSRAEFASQVRSYVNHTDGPDDLITGEQAAFLDALSPAELVTLNHASSNQICEHLCLQKPIDGIALFNGSRPSQVSI